MKPHVRVLIIDDNTSIRFGLQMTMEFEGHDAESSDCGERAIELLKKSTFDVVLLDLNTDGISAREFVEQMVDVSQIRKVDPPKVLLVSGSDNIRFEAKRVGADGWIKKPFGPEEILARLETVIPSYTSDLFSNSSLVS